MMMDIGIDQYIQDMRIFIDAHRDRGVYECVMNVLTRPPYLARVRGDVVELVDGPFSSIAVAADPATDAARLRFEVRNGGRPFSYVTIEPDRWESGVPLPDTGRVALSRDWYSDTSALFVRCSVIVDDARDLHQQLVAQVSCALVRM